MNEKQLTYQQQIEELENSELIITDELRGKKILQNLNYISKQAK